ncbi:MAG: energy transducer TonB [Myxococcota bacterium]|jgi:periplasmic protein TonB|nr:energy transducer TonB [Myxococcota bacterium]
MVVRHGIAAILALGITFGLFYLMQYLISMGSERGADIRKGQVIEFVRLKRDSATQTRKRELPKKENPPEPPPPPDLKMSKTDAPDANAMAIAAPDLSAGPDLGSGPNLGAPSDSDSVPLVRVPPQYPIRAAERGIEGWVVLRFTITATGTVENPEVIDSKPKRIFDRAAIRALKKWKYRPRVVDGQSIARTEEVKLSFDLDDI